MISRCRLLIMLGVVLSLVMAASVSAQQRHATGTNTRTQTSAPAPQAQPAQTDKPTAQPTAAGGAPAKPKELAKGTWQLKVGKAQPQTITLKANEARVAEIAAELSRRLKLPVQLSPVMEKARITVEFANIPIEGALRMIATEPYVDYEITGDGAQPKIIGIYLYGLNEPPPSESAVVQGDSEAILIEGNTEDGVDGQAEKNQQEKSLSVKIERNQVTVHARRQPLSVVLYEVASKFDIPFDPKYDTTELVDVDLSNVTMEQLVRTLSPNIRLYQRTDLQTYETRPLRIVLAPPTSTQQTTKM